MTRTTLRYLLPILAISFGFSDRLNGKEILSNPGFEDAVIASDGLGWDRRGSKKITLKPVKSPVVEGRYALLVEGRGAEKWEGLKQELDLEKNVRYVLRGAIRLATGEMPDRAAIQLVIVLKDGKKVFQDVFRGKVTAESYTAFTEEFVITKDSIEVSLSIHGVTNGKSFIVDDFSVTEAE
jgi:hypothetical protein